VKFKVFESVKGLEARVNSTSLVFVNVYFNCIFIGCYSDKSNRRYEGQAS